MNFYFVVYLVTLSVIKLHSDDGRSMSMNMGWNDELSRKDQGTQRKMSYCCFIHYMSHMDFAGIKLGFHCKKSTANHLSYGTHFRCAAAEQEPCKWSIIHN